MLGHLIGKEPLSEFSSRVKLIIDDMRQSSDRLRIGDTDKKTQEFQKAITRELELLIEEIRLKELPK